jgi:hypothetical protein
MEVFAWEGRVQKSWPVGGGGSFILRIYGKTCPGFSLFGGFFKFVVKRSS